MTTPVAGNGRFSVAVGLVSNRLNRLFASAAGAAGSNSPTTTIDVIQDIQAPALFVDDPVSGIQVVNDTIDVAGRVADVLSGFLGLTVTVNGQPAHVDIGIGTNGSFLRTAVPLTLGANDITVEATDGASNKTTRHTIVEPGSVDGPKAGAGFWEYADCGSPYAPRRACGGQGAAGERHAHSRQQRPFSGDPQ